MGADSLSERRAELAHDVLFPLVLGGPLYPVRPFGGPLALRLGQGVGLLDAEFSLRIDDARLRRARLLTPVDQLLPLSGGDVALLATFNDLIQLTNHHLGGRLSRSRYARLLVNVRFACEHIEAPRDVASALSRHATFAKALEAARTDTQVSWWTGSASFRGTPPPSRLLAWRELRRVVVNERRVRLPDMPLGLVGVSPDAFADVLSLWLSRSPLTDLATATRAHPAFAWSATTLSLASVSLGRALALRALYRRPRADVIVALKRATAAVPAVLDDARGIAERFTQEAVDGFTTFGEPSSALA